MAKYAWVVAKEIRERLDDASVMGEYVKSFLAEEYDRGFFHGDDHLKLFIDNRNKKQQQNVYQEFIKEGCQKTTQGRRNSRGTFWPISIE